MEEDCYNTIFFFFSNTKKKKHARKQQKETNRKERTYFQAPILPSHFWLPLLSSCFCLLTFVLPFQALSLDNRFYPPIFGS
jgi:hypothetical protein